MLRFGPPILVAALAACARAPAVTPAPAVVESAPLPTPMERIAAQLDSALASPAFAGSQWGILVHDPASGDTLLSRQAGKLFVPASALKLVTAAVALERLGPEHRFTTTLVAREGRYADYVEGDLLVIGRGDPTVNGLFFADAMTPLRAMADSLYAAGVRRIRGRVLPHGDAFPGPVLGTGWMWDELADAYAAPVDELLFELGLWTIETTAPHLERPVRVTTTPSRGVAPLRVTVESVPVSGETAVRAARDTGSSDVIVSGTIRVGDRAVDTLTQERPARTYAAALGDALEARGIRIEGRTRASERCCPDTLLVHRSPPLREILPQFLGPSQNQIGEMLFRAVALEATGVGSVDSARAVVTRQLAAWGAPAGSASVRDGSGLSRYDLVSPQALLRVLDVARTAPWGEAFRAALPIAGVSGTLERRMRGTAAAGRVVAKTGTMSHVRSLAGYVPTADGRTLTFVIMANNFTAPMAEVMQVQEMLVVSLAELRAR